MENQEQELEALKYINPDWSDQELWKQFEIAKEAAKVHGVALIFKITWCIQELQRRELYTVEKRA